ncbi:MAG: hypothetical protein E6J90_43780 [Deltaproteobacteria bacterium]|nr:MAG: hypothetical protein E6J90_43780 [Deltaproteobacteria bacterium]
MRGCLQPVPGGGGSGSPRPGGRGAQAGGADRRRARCPRSGGARPGAGAAVPGNARGDRPAQRGRQQRARRRGGRQAGQRAVGSRADRQRRGRDLETLFVGGTLYLRPRYQRWHAREPEAPDEPTALRDQYFDAVAATWDLLSPGVELTDRGRFDIAGRPGRKIEIVLDAEPHRPPAEPIAQRRWREGRSVDAVAGEVVLDAEKGVPLAVKLSGSVGFSRDGRRFTMKASVEATISGLGTNTVIAAPPDAEVVTTPERLREVDDRDYLLQGIAPPLRRNPDGTAVTPTPNFAEPPARPADKPAKPAEPARPDKARPDKAKPTDKARSADKARPTDKAKAADKGDAPARPRAKPDGATP